MNVLLVLNSVKEVIYHRGITCLGNGLHPPLSIIEQKYDFLPKQDKKTG